MRSLGRMAVGITLSACCALALARPASADTELLAAANIDAGFEVLPPTGSGWGPTNGTLSASSAIAPHAGANAGKFEATNGPTASFTSWPVNVAAGGHYEAHIWVYSADSRVSELWAELSVDGLPANVSTKVGPNTNTWIELKVGPIAAPANASQARLIVRMKPSAPGATFYVDHASLLGPPTPTPTPLPTETPTPTPTASPTATSTPAGTSTAIPTPVATPLPTATTSPRSVYASLINGGFETLTPLDGWTNVGGIASPIMPGLDGSPHAALLVSDSASTKWLYQTVAVTGGTWYAGRAALKPLGEGAATWLRVAWYASTDAEGSQLTTADSNLVATEGIMGIAELGPVQAPAAARSARVRIMLRPFSAETAGAIADNVRFEPTAAPPATPTPTPMLAITPTVVASARPSLPAPSPPAAAAESALHALTPEAAPPVTRPASPRVEASRATVDRPAPSTPQPAIALAMLLRITEFLPDPAEPGNDADFEWVEVANIGAEPASLDGVLLADNQGEVALPAITLAPGAVLVVSGSRAAVPESAAWWPPDGFSNGLANGGDRLSLRTVRGATLDALSYGSDTTFDRPPLPAPGLGKSLSRRFADDGSFAGVEVSSHPTPGVVTAVDQPVAAPGRSVASAATAGRSLDPVAWAALSLIGVGALGAAAAQRYRVVRSRDNRD